MSEIEAKREKMNKTEPLPGAKILREQNGLSIYLYPTEKFNSTDEADAKCLMVVGQTGSGKTTLLNSLTNYIAGINFEDDFRYVLIDENTGRGQPDSQTSDVTIYYIKGRNGLPSLKIIDIPDFGDYRGIDMDKQITDLIEKKLQNELDVLTAVCIVAPGANARLTVNQKYIFSKIMKFFGDDIAENFVFMVTFCDGAKPPIINALESDNSIFKEIIPKIKGNWYLEFNNSGIYSENTRDSSKIFWELGMESFKDFFSKLNTLLNKSLKLSKEVINERKIIEQKFELLNLKLNQGFSMMEDINKQMELVKTNESIINNAKCKLKIPITVQKQRKKPTPSGTYTNYCNRCCVTCHGNCNCSNDEKQDCCAISNDFCIKCPGKCHFSHHSHYNYSIETYTVTEYQTNEELEKKYNNACSDLLISEQIIEGKQKELEQIQLDCLEKQDDIKKSIDKLKQIALNTNIFESSEEYFELMILGEKQEEKKGYQQRIKALNELKEQHKRIRELYQGKNNTMEEFDKFKSKMSQKKRNKQEVKGCCVS